jgi:hypothetical protein
MHHAISCAVNFSNAGVVIHDCRIGPLVCVSFISGHSEFFLLLSRVGTGGSLFSPGLPFLTSEQDNGGG